MLHFDPQHEQMWDGKYEPKGLLGQGAQTWLKHDVLPAFSDVGTVSEPGFESTFSATCT